MHLSEIKNFQEKLPVGSIVYKSVVDKEGYRGPYKASIKKLVVTEVSPNTLRLRPENGSFIPLLRRSDLDVVDERFKPKLFTDEKDARKELQKMLQEKIERIAEVLKDNEKDLLDLRSEATKLIVKDGDGI